MDEPEFLKEGMVLRKLLRPSEKNPDDAIAFHNKMAIIVKDARLKGGSSLMANIRIDTLKERFAFASLI